MRLVSFLQIFIYLAFIIAEISAFIQTNMLKSTKFDFVESAKPSSI